MDIKLQLDLLVESYNCEAILVVSYEFTFLLLCVLSLQDALASFDFLNKRNSIAVKGDLDGVVEQEIQHPDLELIAIQKDADIR